VQHFLKTHGVNLAMALKYPVYEKAFSNSGLNTDSLFNGMDALLRHHGNALGIFSSDEHLDGVGPRQGVELCAIVESMFLDGRNIAFDRGSTSGRLHRIVGL
jgi:hypothetical protein